MKSKRSTRNQPDSLPTDLSVKTGTKSNEISPTEPTGNRLALFLLDFPPVPEEFAPRELVFDSLSVEEMEALKARRYKPILLRWLPRDTEEADRLWLARLMQGVAEATVRLDKDRATALELELKVRKVLYEKGGKLKEVEKPVAQSPLDNLKWGASRHAFTGNTTMVDPEKVAAFTKAVAASADQGGFDEASQRGQGSARRTRKR